MRPFGGTAADKSASQKLREATRERLVRQKRDNAFLSAGMQDKTTQVNPHQ